ncbi:hypothetical protein S7711_06898 [Stachybotrys chartarum IBT 7711]|uniref:Glycosyltransferase family 31 protein n=1 Tax=Stachybotrys chartarum (strain CBS 109288 / IBT 7711) TaxID=1280523 RepID=A0A084ANS0_STACB|nr:hypothetical protein S7711_06898 [Stachybotrys chartarum IBT 7711]
MLSARLLTRRSVVIAIIVGTLVGALLIASRRLDEFCPAGDYCDALVGMRHKVPASNAENVSVVESDPHHQEQERPLETPVAQPAADPSCENFPDTSNVLLVMKTGASEAYSKVPTQVLTNLRCLPEYFIFSDMDQHVAGVHIHDSLDTVLPEVKNSSSDFKLYFRQQKCAADQESCDKYADTAAEGWALDKYKNIHIAEKAYNRRPDYDWYLFVDADTYVLWPTMVEWLKQFDPTDPHYLGSVAYLGNTPFGHGGSGYLVSQAAMHDFFHGKTNVANRWDSETTGECCGDLMFSVALKEETGVGVNNTWPTINGEKPFTLAYGSSQWCQPITTMHHIGSEEVSEFHAFELSRNFSSPMRIKDIYHQFVEPRLKPFRADWDNMSDDWMYVSKELYLHLEEWQRDRVKQKQLSKTEEKAHLNSASCREACENHDDCFQWKYEEQICSFAASFKHGRPAKPSTKMAERALSGWNVNKIKAWVIEHDDCGEIVWPNLE